MRTHGPGLRLPLLIAFGVALALLTSTPATAQVDCGATFPECNGECPLGLFCLSDSSGTGCVCTQPAGPCEDAVHPECDGECPPDQICDPDPAFPFCVCRPLVLPCENSFLEGCEGECPLNQECRHIPGTENCECVEAFPPCGDAVYPTCDGLCPPNEDCVENLQTMGCRCEPTAVTCDQSPHPVCDGTCPPGEVCLGINGTSCECLPETDSCDQSAFPACDAPCPAGEVCINDGSTCRCEPEIVACDLAPFPTCDGTCPPTETCVSDGLAACFCQPETVACEQSPFPTCDGTCPPGTVCVSDDTTQECICEPEIVPCELSPFPECDGECPPGEFCFENPANGTCFCQPEPCEMTPFPACDGPCPPGTICVSDDTTQECICEPEIVPCELSPFPECDGECPPGEFCFENPANGTCFCQPEPCEMTPYPACDGPCPTGTVCVSDDTTQECICEPEIVPCELSPFPECDGECPPGEFCFENPANGTCFCQPEPCEMTPYPACDGPCPTGTVCVSDDTTQECICEPEIVPCELSPFPECDGECPPGEFCFENPANGTCFCQPEPCEMTPYPACDGPCPTGTVCVSDDTTQECICEPEIVPCELSPFPECDGECPPGEFCFENPANGTCICQPEPCEMTPYPACDGPCPPGTVCVSDDTTQECICEPEIVPCELSPFPECDGECPPGEFCFENPANGTCICQPEPCEMTPYPACDGPCPPGTVCVSDDTTQECICEPEIVPCELSPFPECDGECPPGEFCFENPANGTCICQPEPCEMTPYPACDGPCPPGTVCVSDDTTQECICEPEIVPCELSPFPECDGECPPGEFCFENPASGTCICQPEPCEMTPYPACDGPCPTGTVCVSDDTTQECICEPEIVPCEQSLPVCDGFCTDPTEVCTPVATDVILTSPELPPESDPPDCDQLVSQYEGQGVHMLFPGGIDLSDPIHRCFRNVFREASGSDEIETFESTLEALVDLGAGPFAVTLTGPVTVVTSDKVGHTTGTFDTEIVSMSLSGVVGGTPIEIRESPTLVSAGQTTITDLGGGLYHIDSFFDVFTELSVDGGSFQPQINEAARMTLGPTAPDSCVCQPVPCEQSPFPLCDGECPPGTFCFEDPAGATCRCEPEIVECEQSLVPLCDGECPPDEICAPVATNVILASPELPPESDPPDCDQLVSQYEGQGVHVLFPGGIELSDPIHRCFRNVIREAFGADERETFESTLEALVDLGAGPIPVTLTGPVTVVTSDKVGQTTGTFATEIVSMSLSGVVGGTPIEIRESPTLVSAGQTTITDLGGGLYHIDSFFDVFTELSVDGGSLQPQINEAARMTLGPTAADSCECRPIPCEQSDPLVCDGPCPNANEVCTIDPAGGPCFCEVPQLPCEQTSPPTCDGFCTDPTEVCAPVATDVILTSPELPPESDPPDCDQLVSQYEGQGVHVLFPGGIDLSDPIHRCFRNVIREAFGADEIETFESTLEALVDLGAGPFAVTLTGPVTVVTSDKVGQTTGTFDTEIVSMSLSGDVGGTPIEIRESPSLASAGRTTITDLGGGLYHIDSFFDVFTELSVDGGSFQPQINEAARMTLGPTAADSCECQPIPCEQSDPLVCDGPCPNANEVCTIDPAGGPCFCEVPQLPCEQTSPPTCDGFCTGPTEVCAPVATDVILTSPELPPESDPPDCDQLVSQYEGQGVHVLFPGGIDLSDPIHRCFRNVIREAFGADERETFDSTLEALVDLGAGPFAVTLTGPVTVVTSDKVGQTTGTFDTEIVSMSLSGVVGGIPIEIRESPSLASAGRTTITDLGGGLYQIDSFFDVFTELSVDGGSFQPQINEAARMTLGPTAADSCECRPIPCEQSPYPTCDGECPPGEFCFEDPANGTCICEPEIVPCEESIFPVCDGECPPDEICVPDSLTGHCRCEPLVMCEQSPFPECDGACPPGLFCAPDLGTGLCRCLPIEEPCEEALFPQCEGQCPPDEFCIDDPSGACICEPLFPCETALFPECEGVCPPGELCVEVPGTNFCRCEPVPPPFCELALAPVCDGNCPPGERCTPLFIDGYCECIPCIFVVPGSGIEIVWPDKVTIDWDGIECALFYNVYRRTALRLQDGDGDGLADSYGSCFLFNVPTTQAPDGSTPAQGFTNYYLVTGENFVGEGSMGFNSSLQPRPNLFPCP